MSYDVVILVPEFPKNRDILGAISDIDPQLRLRTRRGGTIVEIADQQGRSLVAFEPTQQVDVPGEADRLLAPGIADGLPSPFWWIETRTRAPEARWLSDAFAEGLVRRLGGVVWRSSTDDSTADAKGTHQ
ncbi:hypothetical protein O4J56_03520 [Nocardiopsis sp. RSe5-2]|uniref:Uncharacterized protein n=1 Tax=Nocardiopsis endophytica TaxID=3018445 RepID=A0ABT4TYD1_9ACTN|nr:hypothetical protein [Nocardiopsis endophytica]MDA2809702.1 hypothetical protein [Nocardiopsis endophytica]